MKKLASLTLTLLCLPAFVGCSTPGYSAKERGNMIARNIALDWQMMNDDIDRFLLLRPPSQLTIWHIR